MPNQPDLHSALTPNNSRQRPNPLPTLTPDLSKRPSPTQGWQPGDRPLPGVDLELVRLIGRGGCGEVWKARNPFLTTAAPVALKVCWRSGESLRREAALLDRLRQFGSHPGIVRLLTTYLSADPPALVSEFIAGGDLAHWLHAQGRPPPGEAGGPAEVVSPKLAAALITQIAEAVRFAHQLQPPVIHRDLKPSNILVVSNPTTAKSPGRIPIQLKVTDFGIGALATTGATDPLPAHSLTDESLPESTLPESTLPESSFDGWPAAGSSPHTLSGASTENLMLEEGRLAYTPLYASPQQQRGCPADPRDDLYALGVIWYQLLLGDLAAAAPTGRRWMDRLGERGVPADQIELLAGCLEPEADDRPASVAVLLDRLRCGPLHQDKPSLERDARSPATRAASNRSGQSMAGSRTIGSRNPVPRNPGPKNLVLRNSGHFSWASLPPARIPKPTQGAAAQRSPETRKKNQPAQQQISPQKTLVNSLGMTMVPILSGEFWMGGDQTPQTLARMTRSSARRYRREQPRHRVRFSRTLLVAVTPVTQEQFERVMGFNPSHFQTGLGTILPTQSTACWPVEQVSWEEAAQFCQRLTQWTQERPTGRVYRLPTEAEWEYLCRAGSETAYWWGDQPAEQPSEHPFAVGSGRPNAWGLFDVHGNVRQWCADWFSADYYRDSPLIDPPGPCSSVFGKRVIRGGSYCTPAVGCRAAARHEASAQERLPDVGLRVVCQLKSD